LADLLQGEERLALFADPRAQWAWGDERGMYFARGRVLRAALLLEDETRGPRLGDERYRDSVFPSAVLDPEDHNLALSRGYHRSDMPVCLMASLLARGNIPDDAFAYRAMLAGNVAHLDATLGEFDDAFGVLAEVRDAPMPRDQTDDGWSIPTRELLTAPIAQIQSPNRTRLGSHFLEGRTGQSWHDDTGWHEDGTIWVMLDQHAGARQGLGPNEVRDASIRRLREVLLQRETCVPLHMLQGFDVK
jgi:hypothetical protein